MRNEGRLRIVMLNRPEALNALRDADELAVVWVALPAFVIASHRASG